MVSTTCLTSTIFEAVVNKVMASGSLVDSVSAFFEKQIHPKSASSLRITKAASSMVAAEQYKSFIGRLEKLYLEDLMSTNDAVEGIEAFLGKRAADWKNR